MSMLATTWEPSLNPLGPASLFALGAAGLTWFLIDWRAKARFRAVIILFALVIFGAFLVVSAANIVAFEPLHLRIKLRRFPDFDDFLGNWIVLAVGLVFSFKLIRRPMGWVRDVGLLLTVVWCGVVLAELVGSVYWLYVG
jgi:hypothetical protein